jgi:phage terminase large subunit
MQLILRDAARYRDAQKAVPAKASKPVPPVQRPGTSQPKGSVDEAKIKNLESKLEKSGDMKDAVALMLAKRAAR